MRFCLISLLCVGAWMGSRVGAETPVVVWNDRWDELEKSWADGFDRILVAIQTKQFVEAHARLAPLVAVLARLNHEGKFTARRYPAETSAALRRILIDRSRLVAGRLEFFDPHDQELLSVLMIELGSRAKDKRLLARALRRDWWAQLGWASVAKTTTTIGAAGLTYTAMGLALGTLHFHKDTFQTPLMALTAILAGLFTAWNLPTPLPRVSLSRRNLVAPILGDCSGILRN